MMRARRSSASRSPVLAGDASAFFEERPACTRLVLVLTFWDFTPPGKAESEHQAESS